MMLCISPVPSLSGMRRESGAKSVALTSEMLLCSGCKQSLSLSESNQRYLLPCLLPSPYMVYAWLESSCCYLCYCQEHESYVRGIYEVTNVGVCPAGRLTVADTRLSRSVIQTWGFFVPASR